MTDAINRIVGAVFHVHKAMQELQLAAEWVRTDADKPLGSCPEDDLATALIMAEYDALLKAHEKLKEVITEILR